MDIDLKLEEKGFIFKNDGIIIETDFFIGKDGWVYVKEEDSEVVLSAQNVHFGELDKKAEKMIEEKGMLKNGPVYIKIDGYVKRKEIDVGENKHFVPVLFKHLANDVINYDKDFMEKAGESFKLYENINNKRLSKLITLNPSNPSTWAFEFYYG